MKKVVAIAGLFAAMLICYSFYVPDGEKARLSFKGAPKTKAQLGEALFFETMLSANNSISCASCHIPSHAFADSVAFSKGVGGRLGKRNAPTCMNLSDRPSLFFDGRAASLEDQVKFPIEDHNEMAISITDAVKRLSKSKQYLVWFKKIYKSAPTIENLENAIAAYERTLETSHTPYDRYMMNDDSTAISISAMRGRELFMGNKAKCFDCHFTPDFTGDEFRNVGLFDGKKYNDSGRYLISKNPSDIGKFKVPGLRNVAITWPYMHNGMFKSLKEVIEYYDNPYKMVATPINIDTNLAHPLNLTAQEKTDLENFLISLTDDRFTIKK